MDCVIINSLWNEPFPRVLIEAYAFGRPVIAARTGGTPEMVSEGLTGYTFDPRQLAQLIEHMQVLAAMNQEQWEEFQSQVITFFRENIPDETQGYLQVYQSLLQDRQQGQKY